MGENIRDFGGLALVLIAIFVVAWKAIIAGSEPALGAMISVLAAGVGYYLRGRVETPAPPRPPSG